MLRALHYRTHPRPSRPLPLNVRSAGHYILPAGRSEQRAPGNFVQIFWCQSGAGIHQLRGKRKFFTAGDAFYYAAGETHHLEATTEPLDYRWLTLDGPHAAEMLEGFKLRRQQASGPVPAPLFEELEESLRDATLPGEYRASAIAYQILLRLTCPTPTDTGPEETIAAAAKLWIEENFSNPRWDLTALAERLRIHRSTLYRAFIRQHGVSPVQYLKRLRIRHALDLLQSTHRPIAEIARQTGVLDLAYFSRLIRQQTGLSPRAYRESLASFPRRRGWI